MMKDWLQGDNHLRIYFSLLFIIIVAGFSIRLLGVKFGLPDSTYVDSGHTIIPAKRIAYNILQGKFDIDTQTYLYPALFYNLLATEFITYGVLYGIFGEGKDLSHKDFSHKINFLFNDASRAPPTKSTAVVFTLRKVASNSFCFLKSPSSKTKT